MSPRGVKTACALGVLASRSICALLAFCLMVTDAMTVAAAQTHVEMVVYRSENTVDFFFKAPFPEVMRLLGSAPSDLLLPDGAINHPYVKERNWEIAQELWEPVAVTVGGAQAEMEATSFFVHPQSDRLPFRTPYDAMIAISACTVPLPDTPLLRQNANVYMGFIGFVADSRAPIEIAFDVTLNAEIPIVIRDYWGSELVREKHQILVSGEAIVLPAVRSFPMMALVVAVAITAFASMALYWFYGRSRRAQWRARQEQ